MEINLEYLVRKQYDTEVGGSMVENEHSLNPLGTERIEKLIVRYNEFDTEQVYR